MDGGNSNERVNPAGSAHGVSGPSGSEFKLQVEAIVECMWVSNIAIGPCLIPVAWPI